MDTTAREQDQEGDDLQRHILQDTLIEVAARDEDAAECCVICLDVVAEPCEALPCGHRNFDYLCVSSWLFETPQCPLCKATVEKIVHGPRDKLITTLFDQKPKATPSSSAELATGGRRFTYYSRRGRFQCRQNFPSRFRNEEGSNARSDAVATRRDVYRRQRYSKHVGSNRVSRYQELTPHMFVTDTDLVSRARMWVRRELRVFSFLSPEQGEDDASEDVAPSRPPTSTSPSAVQQRRANNAEFLLEYIIAILKSVDIMGSSGQAEDMLSDFLGRDNTMLFLHELRAWLRSPFTKLEDWDRAVQYDEGSDRGRVRERSRDAVRSGSSSGAGRESTRWKGDFYRPQGRGRTRRIPRRSVHERYDEARTRSASPRR